ncbi:PIN domain-containing protein [Paenarthrobacter nicotinovorans]|uniref:PIN domain-containing protein n=1 Tax=Paenarthrobacter nicotinovorans TaxID=29320 RepID=UPI0011A379BD|nr:PIN domain-containing protein [Paenarthrobacter nicotinovorans]
MAQRVFVDANVLFSRTLRDWLFLLRIESNGGMFQLHTTWDAIAEAGARLRDDPNTSGDLLASLMKKIQECVDEVVTAFPGGPVEGIADEGDWHVHHAAEACRAHVLLTDDAGFESDDSHYEVYTCDDFFLEVGRSAPDVVKRVVETQALYWSRRSGKQLPDALRDAGCLEFADVVLGFLKEIAAR